MLTVRWLAISFNVFSPPGESRFLKHLSGSLSDTRHTWLTPPSWTEPMNRNEIVRRNTVSGRAAGPGPDFVLHKAEANNTLDCGWLHVFAGRRKETG